MKLNRLEMVAFGPFTGTVLDFAGKAGLHVVHGPNEAGKSSSMRALRHFLYGIPHRFDDNFLHENKAIEIRGELVLSDGTELNLRRRKARKNDLVDLATDQPLDQARLTALLGGVGEDVFRVMFGFDHQELSAGGQDVLQSGGALGRTLFAAASGVVHLREALARLKAEEEALFTPRGGAGKRVNAALARLKELRREEREALVTPARWQELTRSRDDLSTRLEALQADLDAATRDRNRLERLVQAAAPARRRAELQAKLAGLGHAPRLSADFSERRVAASLGCKSAAGDEERAIRALAELDERLAALAVHEELNAVAEQVDRLYRETSQHAKAEADIAKRFDERRLYLAQAERILGELRPGLALDEARTLRISSADKARIQDLGRRFEALAERRDAAAKELARRERAQQGARQALAEVREGGDTTELKALLDRTSSEGDPQIRWREAHDKREALEARAAAELNRLGRWQGDLAQAAALPVPEAALVQRHESRLATLEAERKSAVDTERTQADKCAGLEAELKRFLEGGPVPRPRDLRQARDLRDSGWSLIRRTLAGNEPGDMELSIFLQNLPAAGDLPEAFEASLRRADDLADGLYRDADRVARRSELEAALERERRTLASARQRLEELEAEAKARSEAWQALWAPSGIEPGAPAEMVAWLGGWKRLLDMLDGVREERGVEDRIAAMAKELRQALTTALERLGEPAVGEDAPLASVLALSQAALERQAEARRQAKTLAERVAEAQAAVDEARAAAGEAGTALDAWTGEWARAVAPLGLGPEDKPVQAQAVLDELGALFQALDDAEKLEARVAAMRADYEAYATEVRTACRSLAPDLDAAENFDPAAAATELFQRLKASQSAEAQRRDLTDRRREQTALLEAARKAAAEHAEALNLLCGEAACPSPGDLEAVEAAARERGTAETDLAHVEERLLALTGNMELDAFAVQAMQLDPDAAAADIARLDAEVKARTAERDTLLQELGGLDRQLAEMDGTSLAAEKAQEAASLAADIQTDVDRVVRLRLAAAVVAREVERYRRDNQGPVLDKASAIFSELTLGSFSGLEVDFDDKGEPELLGARPSGERLGPQGMSDGTRDQLYLALRLAGLHRYLDDKQPMPFVVDDILVHFDDERSKATLKVLAQLARRTQIVFFTHHAHLVDLARESVPAEQLAVHEL